MILSDRDIKKRIKDDSMVYANKKDSKINLNLQLGPSSFDLRLKNEFVVFDGHNVKIIDPKDKKMTINGYAKKIKVKPNQGFILHPGDFVLATTIEKVKIPNNMVARLEGRSSYGRLGLMVHSTAGYIDPGFEGEVTLELHNIGRHPIILYPQERICHLVFEIMSSYATIPYGNKKDCKYMGQIGATKSKIFNEIRESDNQ